MVKIQFDDEEVKKSWLTWGGWIGGILLLLTIVIIAPFYYTSRDAKNFQQIQANLVKLSSGDGKADAAKAAENGETTFLTMLDDKVPGIPNFDEAFGDKYKKRKIKGLVANPDNDGMRLQRRIFAYASEFNKALIQHLEPPQVLPNDDPDIKPDKKADPAPDKKASDDK